MNFHPEDLEKWKERLIWTILVPLAVLTIITACYGAGNTLSWVIGEIWR